MDNNKKFIRFPIGEEEVQEDTNLSSTEINIKPILSLQEMLTFVETVVQSCVSAEDGEYLPEIKEFTILCEVYNRYTDIELPNDINERYIFVYESLELTNKILSEINEAQFNHIMKAIDEKIYYHTYTHQDAVKKQMDEIRKLIIAFNDLFSDVDKASINDLVNVMIDGFNGGDFVNRYVNSIKAGDE